MLFPAEADDASDRRLAVPSPVHSTKKHWICGRLLAALTLSASVQGVGAEGLLRESRSGSNRHSESSTALEASMPEHREGAPDRGLAVAVERAADLADPARDLG